MKLTRYVNEAVPSVHVQFWVIQIPKGPESGFNEFVGGFETEDDAASWAGHNMPTHILFRTVPVFGSL